MSQPALAVSPDRLMATFTAYQRTAALKGALDLDLFTALAQGPATASVLAARCAASPRGMRILCDYLTIEGFLTKDVDRYTLTPESAALLDRRSPAYLGGAARFLLSPAITEAFRDVAAAVRHGGTVMPGGGTMSREHPIWVEFARGMMPMMSTVAEQLVALVPVPADRSVTVLDIAAGHGMFGIAFARRYPAVEVVAVDWPQVLAVAEDNARAAGVSARYRTIAGSAFEVDYGRGYDLALFANFLHHFDLPTCERLLAKVRTALGEGGRAVSVEFVPNEDRVSPAPVAGFSLVMLCSTPSGDAYTFTEMDQMLRAAGFARNELHALPASPHHAIISYR